MLYAQIFCFTLKILDFTLDFYFRQSWKDDRLAFKARTGLDSLTVGAEVADLIWVPDTFFANEKTAYFHQATTPNTFLRINSEGEVFRSMRSEDLPGVPLVLLQSGQTGPYLGLFGYYKGRGPSGLSSIFKLFGDIGIHEDCPELLSNMGIRNNKNNRFTSKEQYFFIGVMMKNSRSKMLYVAVVLYALAARRSYLRICMLPP
ncbi:gamma-aminobutyric acid receptor subunit beta [Trichonephila clavipes]|nr:gamma-aminobutyric acid receptor subunit beta [Trichonephila clavipes]